MGQLCVSILESGFTNPILISERGVVIAGHARLAAARWLGMTEVPVLVLDHLSETQLRALVLAGNKLALNAGWDMEMLRVELDALSEEEFESRPGGTSAGMDRRFYARRNQGVVLKSRFWSTTNRNVRGTLLDHTPKQLKIWASCFSLAMLLTPAAQSSTIYTFTGGLQSFLVPADVSTLLVKLWGAGGGLLGGAGGFSSGEIAVTPGETLTILVGGGGAPNFSLIAPGGFGGGGDGYGDGTRLGIAGGGGGRSAIILSGTELIDAGGGGGGFLIPGSVSCFGGGGGGTAGLGSTCGGGGGTQSAGGAPNSSIFPDFVQSGSAFQGGAAWDVVFPGPNGGQGPSGGGGGGGGYFGGGGGAIGGGGGGSGYIGGLGVSNASTVAGPDGSVSFVFPQNTGDPDYIGGVGWGGSILSGGNGEIVISFTAVPEPASTLPAGLILVAFALMRAKIIRTH